MANSNIKTLELVLRKDLRKASEDIQKQFHNTHSEHGELLKTLAQAMITLARNANTMRSEIRSIKNSAGGYADDEPNAQAIEIAELRSTIRDINARLDAVVEERVSKAAKFFGITLRSNRDCNEWVKHNLDDDSLGVIMDVHLVLEHIYYQMYAGEGLLKTLQAFYKVQIDTITQGLACSSFDTRIPKFFKQHKATETSDSGIKKTGLDQSALDRIPTWDQWDESNSGKRSQLEAHLLEFKMSHEMLLGDLMIPGSAAHTVAMLSARASTSWIQELIAYMDRTYREFHYESGFWPKRAWYIVTSLVHRIFMELSDPRVGVGGLLRLKNNQKTSQLITWPMVQCHEIMKAFKHAKIKDHPCIANESVKFIMKNQTHDDMKAKMDLLQTEIKAIDLKAKGASTSAISASNAATEAKTKITELTKRMAAVEKKS